MPTADPVFAAFCAAGLWPGLGRTLAGELDGARILGPEDVTATKLANLPKVGSQRAGRLLSSFIAAQPIYDVVTILAPAQVDARAAGRVVEALGPGAARLLRDDPWQLLVAYGVVPADADRVARSVLPGVQRDDPRRGRALVSYVLARFARDGHTVASRAAVRDALAEYGIVAAEQSDAAIESAADVGAVVEHDHEGDEDAADIGLARYVQAEDSVAEAVTRLLATAEPIEADPSSLDADHGLDETQMSAVLAALESGVSVLTGGPGTGKSRTVAALVTLAEAAGRSVALAAPTGRAAKRLEELCESPASTLHRLLGAQARSSGEGGVSFDGGFQRGAEWPLDEDVVVVDEASMLDVELADALLTACEDGTHLLFVGDAAQLPSIGPGRVLADLIDSGTVPVTELKTLYRQDAGGAIARLATAVRSGELPAVNDPTHEVVVVPARGSADGAHRVVQLVTDSIPRALGIAVEQIQVVTPVHRGGAGTQALNAALKSVLNPGSGKGRFDVGDRVVATANHLEAEPFGFANGEVGTVVEIDSDGAVTIEFASGPAEVKGKMLADVTHGWAITVHRAQGSEFPAVIVVVPPEAGGMLSRPLIYTALTRAQRHLSVVHCVGPAMARAVQQIGALPRRTRLQQLLREYAES
jgi:exodeoxyribonuclease V alpha subunit